MQANRIEDEDDDEYCRKGAPFSGVASILIPAAFSRFFTYIIIKRRRSRNYAPLDQPNNNSEKTITDLYDCYGYNLVRIIRRTLRDHCTGGPTCPDTGTTVYALRFIACEWILLF
jgi:hypothetical protein